MLLNVVSTSTVVELLAVTVESKVIAPELSVDQLGKPDPALVSTCPLVPAAPARVKAVVRLADAIVGAVSVLLVSVSVVARPTKVSVLVGRVNVPVLLMVAIIGVVSVLLVSVWVPVNVAIPAAARVEAPVPPLATANVPARVTVPEEVIGPPEVVKPVVPPETSTLVTEPAPGPVNATVMAPLPLVMVTPEPAVSVVLVSVLPVLLPMSN